MQDINLCGNTLRALPATLCDLAGLRSISVSYNHITALPAALGQLPALWQLHAGRNELVELPCGLQDAGLSDLDVSGNLLVQLPEWLRSCNGATHGCCLVVAHNYARIH